MPERDLPSLLVTMNPALDPREWVFCCVTRDYETSAANPLFLFRENEGVTMVVERSTADDLGLTYGFPSRRITLRVVSDLEAVGFTAAVAAELSKHTIPVNVASAFHHDHLFVPADRGEEALRVLEDLSAETARRLL
jgi:uncharacterized protein